MAGGEGTRLRPLTSRTPKPMLPMANRPLLEHVLAWLRRHAVVELVVTVGAQAEAIRSYFGDGAELGLRLSYATEGTPLGTAGSVRQAMATAGEAFLVVSGDVLTDVDLGAVMAWHAAHNAEATIATQARGDPLDFGVVVRDPAGGVERLVEKPPRAGVLSDTVNTGIYVLEPTVLDAVPEGRQSDFAGDVFPAMLAAGRPITACVADGYWEDIGTLDAYLRAHRDLLDGRVVARLPGFSVGHGVWLDEGAEVDPTARVEGPAVLGPSCRVEAGAVLGAYTVLGSNVRVGPGATIERSVVHDHVYVGAGASLRGCVVGRSGRIRRAARLEEGSVLGDDCLVGEDATISAGVAVYPAKTVDPGATVRDPIIWESRGARTVLGGDGVVGLANVDLTPELAVRLGMAFATTIPRGGKVVVSRDTSRAGRLLARAVMVGLNASGVDVVDLEVATIPVTRFAVRSGGHDGGITVRLVPGDTETVAVRVLDCGGVDLPVGRRRPLERILARQDVRRAIAGEIGDIEAPAGVAEAYTTALTAGSWAELVGVDAVRRRRPRVVLDYGYGAASFVMPNVLAKLGADVLSVNPYASTRQALTFDAGAHAAEVGRLVVASGAALGAVIDPGGERVGLVDDAGHLLDDRESLAVVLRLVLPAAAGRGSPLAVALPVSAPTVAERLVAEHGARLVVTGLSTAEVLDAALRADAAVAAAPDGACAFPRFLPAFDGVATLVTVLGLLAVGEVPLSELRRSLPVAPVAHESVPVAHERIGAVMRSLVESPGGREITLVEGFKARFADGWALVSPDPEAPLVHVWAEADTPSGCATRVAEYAGRVRAAAAG